MNYKKESLEKLLVLIDDICQSEENLWFKELLKIKLSLQETNSETVFSRINDLKNDTFKIKELLNISPDLQIDYSYIKHSLLRKRLEVDYLRMENVRYNLSEKDEVKRLYDYCVNAFYQIENLINYYYYEKYPKINDLLTHLEEINNSNFKRKDEQNIGDLNISVKIFAFNSKFYMANNNDYTGLNIDNIRKIRNEGVHRCSRIKNIENENVHLHKFLKYATFDSVHGIVNSLNNKIKEYI